MDTALDVVERVARQTVRAGYELVAQDLVNHALGPQGREGLKAIFAGIPESEAASAWAS